MEVRPEALAAFQRAGREAHANPAALHRAGRRAQGVLEDARDRVAAVLRCSASEIIFCSSATEANNISILGAARAMERVHGKSPHLVSSKAEHPSVLGPLRHLQQMGCRLSLVPLENGARVPVEKLLQAAEGGEGANLFALQWANNETGTVQDWDALASAVLDSSFLHCDAVQGIGKLPFADSIFSSHALVVSGHKIGAPKGVAALRLSPLAMLDPVSFGGGHQRGFRPGTESPDLATSFATALELAVAEQAAFARETLSAKTALLEILKNEFPQLVCQQPEEGNSLPNTCSLSFPNMDGRKLLPALDAEGLAVSSGSACSAGAPKPSSVLLACGVSAELARATVRISFGCGQGEVIGKKVGAVVVAVLDRIYKVGNL